MLCLNVYWSVEKVRSMCKHLFEYVTFNKLYFGNKQWIVNWSALLSTPQNTSNVPSYTNLTIPEWRIQLLIYACSNSLWRVVCLFLLSANCLRGSVWLVVLLMKPTETLGMTTSNLNTILYMFYKINV